MDSRLRGILLARGAEEIRRADLYGLTGPYLQSRRLDARSAAEMLGDDGPTEKNVQNCRYNHTYKYDTMSAIEIREERRRPAQTAKGLDHRT